MSKKFVYQFKEGNANMREILGGKGANLAAMTALNLPVPAGFTISTEACNDYYDNKKQIRDVIKKEILKNIKLLEKETGKKFADPKNPLLVSVRSGSRASMPGMMDTILNLGINDEICESIAKLTNNRRFALDSYRRFVQMYADVVMGLEKKRFEEIIDEIKDKKGVKLDTELDEKDLMELLSRFKKFYKDNLKTNFPSDPIEQLLNAVEAVFKSWNNDRAIFYRRQNNIPSTWGTAVNVQMMVFGNMGEDCGTGVAFTRNPSTGQKKLFGEFLINAQGEDVVAGVRTPEDISKLKTLMPKVYDEFVKICHKLEQTYKDMQDMEFTIEHNKLYMLQTRNGKRTATAAIKIACDLVKEGLISKEEAVLMVDAKSLDALLHPQFEAKALKAAKVIAKGLAASPGAASGQLVFNAKDATEWAKDGKKVILARLETSPEDIEGMDSAKGILTIRGGMTSHAAVVARGMGKCCVSGCGELSIDTKAKKLVSKDKTFKEGDYISLDGSTGLVYGEAIETVEATISGDFKKFMKWVDDYRKAYGIKIRANADTPKDAATAVKFGAEGIGLVRTEHMFFAEDRIKAVREMIVAKNTAEREKALDKILKMQEADFYGIFVTEGMAKGEVKPVTVRYLDPPLHEFLPTKEEEIKALAKDLGLSLAELKQRISELHEFNPMMGHRGCRLAVSYPEIARMQTKALISAAIKVNKNRHKRLHVKPEIMIPLVGDLKEFKYIKDIVVEEIEKLEKEHNLKLEYTIGTMIEIPRAAIMAGEIAKEADFFSFGTNDLTQMTFGFSRDDAGSFLNDYYSKNIYDQDPFQTIDQNGVGYLVRLASENGRKTKKNLKLGICGEHGGDPETIKFCHNTGLDYVSCSPYRVPIARLAAAQAAIKNPRK